MTTVSMRERQTVMDGEDCAMDRDVCLETAGCGGATGTAELPEGQTLEQPISAPQPEAPTSESASAQEVREADADIQPTPNQIIEALLFASDTPLNLQRLAELSGTKSIKTVREAIDELNERYAQAGLSFRIEAIARGYQMITLPAYRRWLEKLHHQRAQTRLTGAALETLSIVAYKQPVIRADIEAIRGVACGEVLNRLREMGLVRILGRAEIVGRPMLYGTTRKFLDVFGLADLDDLPPVEALTFKQKKQSEAQPESESEADEQPHPLAAAGA